MATAINLHEGVIRPSLVTELDAYRTASDQQISSYYVDLNVRHWGGNDAVRVAVKDWLAGERERINALDGSHSNRMSLLDDADQVDDAAAMAIGERHTVALACFVNSDAGYNRTLRLPWPVRSRSFFEMPR